jgi:hypothetical protein
MGNAPFRPAVHIKLWACIGDENVRESFAIECEKDSKGSKKPCVETYRLASGSV